MIPFLFAADVQAHPHFKPPLQASEVRISQAKAQQLGPSGLTKSGKFPYASLQLGVGIPNTFNGQIGDINTETELLLNTGFNGEAAAGYKINDFRTDVSVGYSNFPVNQQTYTTPGLGTATFSGKESFNLWTVMLNGYYDIPIRKKDQTLSRWSPYLGAGVGYGNLSIPSCAAANCYSATSSGQFAWQAKAGLSYRATSKGFAFLEGGYLSAAGSTTSDSATFGSFGTWRVNVGWRQGF